MMSCTQHNRLEMRSNGILDGQAYTVISVHEAQGKKLMRLRNPWGQHEWKGDYSDNSHLWTQSLKEEVGWINEEDGIFFMPF
jgi:hypothetical protein